MSRSKVSPLVSGKLKKVDHSVKTIQTESNDEEEGNSNYIIKNWPESLKNLVLESLHKPINVFEATKFLEENGWPNGLINTLLQNSKKIPLRFFVVDDSGSMNLVDGRKFTNKNSKGEKKMEECSRWNELLDSLLFLANFSEIAGIPSEFRLLNGAEPVMLGLGDDIDNEQLKFAIEVFNEKPAGKTPLCEILSNIIDDIRSIEISLKANRQKVAVIIMTDGIATDGDVIDLLKTFQMLPVWLVLRLCTNDSEVVSFWNSIDKELEMEVDVIDDFVGDATEVSKLNSWLTYGEPLHLMRTFGCLIKEIDLIDEVVLGKEQMRTICALMFHGSDSSQIQEFPHPDLDWVAFVRAIKQANNSNKFVFCPIQNKMKPWINIKQLEKCFNRNKRSINNYECLMS